MLRTELVANAQYHQVTLNGVVRQGGGPADVAGPVFGVLIADVNADGRVDSGDVTAVRRNNLKVLDKNNFRSDVNASGRTDSGDVTLTRKQNLTGLPQN